MLILGQQNSCLHALKQHEVRVSVSSNSAGAGWFRMIFFPIRVCNAVSQKYFMSPVHIVLNQEQHQTDSALPHWHLAVCIVNLSCVAAHVALPV